MAIPEAQLQTWSNQGAVATAKATHESVRNALSQATALSGRSFHVFLQGSYKNDTNIRGDSDVDIVVRLNSTFHYDLSLLDAAQQARWAEAYPTRATYVWEHFRGDVLAALVAYYGAGSVNPGRNAVTIAAGGGRLSADVVVATQYYLYTSFGVSTSSRRPPASPSTRSPTTCPSPESHPASFGTIRAPAAKVALRQGD
jgi:Nucleotidyltransferase domain